MLASTFSIVARASNGQLGLAVSSRVVAVGAHCAFVRPNTLAVSSQAYANPFLPFQIEEHIRNGHSTREAVQAVLEGDEGRAWRQVAAIGPVGAPFAYSGSATDAWTGHVVGDDCAAAGNLLVSGDTVTRMVETFESFPFDDLPERLLKALEEGQGAGGDRRGRQSAALMVKASTEVAYVDLRVDDHADPVSELRRIFGLMRPDNLAYALKLATTGQQRSVEELRAIQARVARELAERNRQA